MLASGQALRLALLVATASATGYLWRAALEPPDRDHAFGLQPPGPRFKVPETAFQPLLILTPTAGGRGGHHRVVAPAREHRQGRGRRSGRATLIASFTRTAESRRRGPRGRTRVQSPGHAARKKARKRGANPAPPPPPPPAANPPAPPPPPVQQPPPPPPAPVRTRPGWGRGDKNHVHTGPPGQQKKKKKSKPAPADQDKEKKDKSAPAGEDKEKGKKNKKREEKEKGNSGQEKEKGKKDKK